MRPARLCPGDAPGAVELHGMEVDAWNGLAIDITVRGKVCYTHFLMEHLERSGNQKKKTRFAGLFFSYRPSAGAAPRSVPTQQTVYYVVDHFPSKTFSFKHHLTGEAWPACRAIVPFHSNTT